MERLQKIIAARGVCSRRAAEELITAGRVTCNGKVCKLGDCADESVDMICIDARPLPAAAGLVYLMLHKPKGYVTTMSDEQGRKNVSALVSDCPQRVYPVGRLDMDSEGLLLMTNDGDFANRLMHPKHRIDKIYQVNVDGFTQTGLHRLRQPITLDGYRIQKPDVKLLKEEGTQAQLSVTIHEGKNRQVRRMCARAGMKVRRLVRIQEGKLRLGDLPVGKWRYLTAEEVASFDSDGGYNNG